MKKTLVAVAALVATGAFAQVSIYGLVDLASVKATGTDAVLTHQYAPSHIGFKGSEDLGNGMKANFQISTTAPTQTGGVGSGWESFIGASGAFGEVKAGQFFDPSFIHNATYNVNGMSGFGGITSGGVGLLNQDVALTARQIQYSLPAVVPGLSFVVSQSLGKAAVAADAAKYTAAVAEVADNIDYAIGYSVAGFSVGYANNVNTVAAGTKTTSTGTGVSYDFGMAKVAYNATTNKAGTAATGKGSALGISVPFGAATLAYESSSAKSATAVKSTGSLWQVKYDLSKRTFAMLQYGSTKVATTKTNTTGVGLVHTF